MKRRRDAGRWAAAVEDTSDDDGNPAPTTPRAAGGKRVRRDTEHLDAGGINGGGGGRGSEECTDVGGSGVGHPTDGIAGLTRTGGGAGQGRRALTAEENRVVRAVRRVLEHRRQRVASHLAQVRAAFAQQLDREGAAAVDVVRKAVAARLEEEHSDPRSRSTSSYTMFDDVSLPLPPAPRPSTDASRFLALSLPRPPASSSSEGARLLGTQPPAPSIPPQPRARGSLNDAEAAAGVPAGHTAWLLGRDTAAGEHHPATSADPDGSLSSEGWDEVFRKTNPRAPPPSPPPLPPPQTRSTYSSRGSDAGGDGAAAESHTATPPRRPPQPAAVYGLPPGWQPHATWAVGEPRTFFLTCMFSRGRHLDMDVAMQELAANFAMARGELAKLWKSLALLAGRLRKRQDAALLAGGAAADPVRVWAPVFGDDAPGDEHIAWCRQWAGVRGLGTRAGVDDLLKTYVPSPRRRHVIYVRGVWHEVGGQ